MADVPIGPGVGAVTATGLPLAVGVVRVAPELSDRLMRHVGSTRAAQEVAQPTQALDSTSIFTGTVPGLRAVDPRASATDLNTTLALTLQRHPVARGRVAVTGQPVALDRGVTGSAGSLTVAGYAPSVAVA